jgi:hypothetical protein
LPFIDIEHLHGERVAGTGNAAGIEQADKHSYKHQDIELNFIQTDTFQGMQSPGAAIFWLSKALNQPMADCQHAGEYFAPVCLVA